jgi:hypothetical protein
VSTAPNPIVGTLPPGSTDAQIQWLNTQILNLGQAYEAIESTYQTVLAEENAQGTSLSSVTNGLAALQTSSGATYATQAQVAALQTTIAGLPTEAQLNTAATNIGNAITAMQAQIAAINAKLGIT